MDLAYELLNKETYSVGTLRKNRRSLPKIVKPRLCKMVLAYNNAKGSVDMSDQMTAYSSPLRKTVKWHKKLAIELILNTAMVNAKIMYTDTTQNNISVVDFRKKIVTYLTTAGRTQEIEQNDQNQRPKRLKHEFAKKPGSTRSTRRFCMQCYKDNAKIMPRRLVKNKTKKVSTICVQCTYHYCLPCFNKTPLLLML